MPMPVHQNAEAKECNGKASTSRPKPMQCQYDTVNAIATPKPMHPFSSSLLRSLETCSRNIEIKVSVKGSIEFSTRG
jgi:hypothetical protein